MLLFFPDKDFLFVCFYSILRFYILVVYCTCNLLSFGENLFSVCIYSKYLHLIYKYIYSVNVIWRVNSDFEKGLQGLLSPLLHLILCPVTMWLALAHLVNFPSFVGVLFLHYFPHIFDYYLPFLHLSKAFDAIAILMNI